MFVDDVKRARVLGVTALVVGAAYLSWRAVMTLDGAPALVSVPLLVAEIWGWILLAQLFVDARRAEHTADTYVGAMERATDIVIPASGATLDDVARTLVGCAALQGPVRHTLVIDNIERPAVAEVAQDHGARYEVLRAEHHSTAFALVVQRTDADLVAWIDAGDVPMPELLVAAGARMVDGVAVVQVATDALNRDSLLHLAEGRDEQALDQQVRSIGRAAAGAGPWIGSGSVARVAALRPLGGLVPDPIASTARTAVRLQASGWRTDFVSRPLLGVLAPDDLASYLRGAWQRARARLHLLRTSESPFVVKGLSFRTRLLHLADVTGALDGVRWTILLGVLVATLVGGRLPLHLDAGVAVLFAASAVTANIAWRALSRGTLRFGDRTRASLRTMGVSWRAIGATLGPVRPRAGAARRRSRFAAPAQLPLLTVLLLALEAALVARTLTVWWPHLLPRFEDQGRVVVLAFAVVAIVPMIDVIQVLLRRRQRRNVYRVPADLVATVSGVSVRLVDLTPDGIGARTTMVEPIGTRVPVSIRVPRLRGGADRIELDGIVRHVNTDAADPSGIELRVGIQFVDISRPARDAIVEYCAITSARIDETVRDAGRFTPDDLPVAAPAFVRRGVGVLSAVAIVGATLTLAAGPAVAAPADTATTRQAASQETASRPAAAVATGAHDPIHAPDGGGTASTWAGAAVLLAGAGGWFVLRQRRGRTAPLAR